MNERLKRLQRIINEHVNSEALNQWDIAWLIIQAEQNKRHSAKVSEITSEQLNRVRVGEIDASNLVVDKETGAFISRNEYRRLYNEKDE